MASMSDLEDFVANRKPSPAASNTYFDNSNTEMSHFARIVFLINEQGADRMQQYVLDNLPRGSTIEVELRKKHDKFMVLRKNNRINEEQLSFLYPPPGLAIDQTKIDVSLWYTLVRNITERCKKICWGYYEHNPPEEEEILPYHDVIRIRNARNTLSHSSKPCIGSVQYNEMWYEVASALERLGTSSAVIQEYQARDIDPARTMKIYLRMKEEALQDTEILYRKEMGKKRYMMGGFALLVLVMLGVMGVLSYLTYKYGHTYSTCSDHLQVIPLDGDKGAIAYMPRAGWRAKDPTSSNPRPQRPSNVSIISHTAEMGKCLIHEDCCSAVRSIQKLNMDSGFSDIAFNFLVGDDGVIYEGRGWDTIGAAAAGWNRFSISIGFIGKFIVSPPQYDALDAAQQFLQYMAYKGVLSNNFTIYGLCQIRPMFPDAPGPALYKEVKTWQSTTPGYYWSWREREGSVCKGETSYS